MFFGSSSSSKWDHDKSIAIIGAGFGGIAMALKLKQMGIENFTIYEKASEVGGCWRDNAYPGCSVDVATTWYSLSAAPKPDFSTRFSSQPEIWAYQKDVVTKHGLRPHLRTNTMLVGAAWDASRAGYELSLERTISDPLAPYSGGAVKRSGDIETIFVNFLITAPGGSWSIPKFPTKEEFPGLETFGGEVFHTAAWRHDVDLKGKRVGVVGNGATGCQLVPALAEEPTTEVINIARTPQWLIERPQISHGAIRKWLYKYIPGVQKTMRALTLFYHDLLYVAIPTEPKWVSAAATKFYLWLMRRKAPKKYHKELVPTIAFGCRRVIRDPYFLSSLHKPNISLEWSSIQSITPTGLTLPSGKDIPLDVIVFAIGFQGNADIALPIRGIDGVTMKDWWREQGGPTAYRGTTMPGFPNHWMMLGPNTGSGHASMLFYIECQVSYTAQMLAPLLKKGAKTTTVAVTPEACDAYNKEIQGRLEHTVWQTCSSYYNQFGAKNVALFPGSVKTFWWQLRRPQWSHYLTSSA